MLGVGLANKGGDWIRRWEIRPGSSRVVWCNKLKGGGGGVEWVKIAKLLVMRRGIKAMRKMF